MKKSKVMISTKAKKSILRLVERGRVHRPPEVLKAKADRAEKAICQLAQSRRDAQRLNEHLLTQPASV